MDNHVLCRRFSLYFLFRFFLYTPLLELHGHDGLDRLHSLLQTLKACD
jgi:hypothetical protein